MKKNILLILALFVFGTIFGQEKKNTKKFQQKKLEINFRYGGKYIIDKSPDKFIYITLIDTGNPDFKIEINEFTDKIELKETNIRYNGNRPTSKTNNTWKILLPDYTELEGNGATVDVEIYNVNGIFKISSASGNVRIGNSGGLFDVIGASTNVQFSNLTGKFKVSVNNGDIDAKEITIVGKSKFVTNDGDINITLSKSPENDLSIMTGSGKGIVNYMGNKIQGEFTFKARQEYGRISSPINFQEEKVILDDIMYYEKRTDFGKKTEYDMKSFTVGRKSPKIFMSTVTGKVKLKE